MSCAKAGTSSANDASADFQGSGGAVVERTTTVGVVQGHFPALPEGLVAVLTRPSGSALWG